MRNFLSNLLRDFRTATTARPIRRAPGRANLQLEGLEDRLVLTSANLIGSALTINNIAPGHQIELLSNVATQRQLEVFDNGALVKPNKPLNISSITAVTVQVAGGNNVSVNDSNGMPFASGTTVTLQGTLLSSGGANTLTLTGGLGVSGNEQFVAGGTIFTPSTLSVDNLTFHLSNAIAAVNDSLPITGALDVATSGTKVMLSGSNGSTQILSGLGVGGGSTYSFANKSQVVVNEDGANALVTLNATAAAAGQHSFGVDLSGSDETLQINATPTSVDTIVVAPGIAGNAAIVNLAANSGPVSIAGNSQTLVGLGRIVIPGNLTTAGIEANVSVSNVGQLTVNDAANSTTQEHVTVTESTIFGTGLFGNNAAKLSYSGTQYLVIYTGQLGDTYQVAGSKPGATFTSTIDIADLSNAGLSVGVTLDAGSGLHLDVSNEYLENSAASLFISALGGTFSQPSPVIPPGYEASGAESVTFPGGLTSEINYQDLTSVTNFTGVHNF